MRVWVAGHQGFLGRALVRRLSEQHTVLTDGADLTNAAMVSQFTNLMRPEAVIVSAARQGGILANLANPTEFLAENLQIQTSVFDAARRGGVRRLIFLACGCCYPLNAPQPYQEERLGSGPLEPSSEPFALAKLTGTMMCRTYAKQYGMATVALVPASMYGPGDRFEPARSHVLAALVRKCAEGQKTGEDVMIWGSGRPVREFVYVDDVADACATLLERGPEDGSALNVGSGDAVRIDELASMIREETRKHDGELINWRFRFELNHPDGAPSKVLDSTRMRALGWAPNVSLQEGLRRTVEWYIRTGMSSNIP